MDFEITATSRRIAQIVKPVETSAIICLESAAYFLSIIDLASDVKSVKVFASESVSSPHIEVIHLGSPIPANKELVRFLDCWCTSRMQTIQDILTPAYHVSVDIIEEVIMSLYLDYDERIDNLQLFLTPEQWGVLQRHLPAVKAMLRY